MKDGDLTTSWPLTWPCLNLGAIDNQSLRWKLHMVWFLQVASVSLRRVTTGFHMM